MAQEHSLALTLVLWSLPSPPSAVLVCLPPHMQIVEGVGVRGGQWLAEVGALWVEGTCALSQGPPPDVLPPHMQEEAQAQDLGCSVT